MGQAPMQPGILTLMRALQLRSGLWGMSPDVVAGCAATLSRSRRRPDWDRDL